MECRYKNIKLSEYCTCMFVYVSVCAGTEKQIIKEILFDFIYF